MGDERAFLAALDRNPEDALARLVYADWLEERDDPRGEYLRLLCAAAGWQELGADRASVLDRLQRLGEGLDPGWKSAVQRGANWRTLFEVNLPPPERREYGEEYHFNPPATAEQLDAAERALGVRLPADIRAMWSEFNGVRYTTSMGRQYNRDSYEFFLDVESMAPALASWKEWNNAVEELFDEEYGPGAFSKLLLIQFEGGSGWVLCLKEVVGHPAGTVVFWDHDVFGLPAEATLAANLTDLVCRRYTERFSHW